jgi:hypothetical protein
MALILFLMEGDDDAVVAGFVLTEHQGRLPAQPAFPLRSLTSSFMLSSSLAGSSGF